MKITHSILPVAVITAILLSALWLLVMLCGIFVFFSPLVNKPTDIETSPLYWTKDGAHFVDYVIDNDEVIFRYSIRFVNQGDEDAIVSLTARFVARDMEGWIEPQYSPGYMFDAFDPETQSGYYTIKAGETKDVIFTFKGKYLGGEVNTNISYPETVALSIQFVTPEKT